MTGLWYVLLWHVVSHVMGAEEPKIAIVGSGIGGSSAAYFLSSLLPKAQIKVFEGGQQGGRLRGMNIGGKTYDSGGSVIHSANLYARLLTDKTGLEVENLSGDSSFALYDGKDYTLNLSGGVFDKLKILGHFGFGLKTLAEETEKLINSLNRVYCLQKHKVAFRTVEELLRTLDPNLFELTKHSLSQVLTKAGISKKIQDELITAVTHSNYNQEITDIPALVGYVSAAGGLVGKLWRVKGGNFQLPLHVLQQSGAALQKYKVKEVTKLEKGFNVKWEQDNGEILEEEFAAVIIAAPMVLNDVKFNGVDVSAYKKPYQRTVATFVNGVLAEVVLGTPNPDDILTTKGGDRLFSSLSKKGKSDKDFNYKIFTKRNLTKPELDQMFDKIYEIKVEDWQAYPEYKVPDSLPPFQLSSGLYYINAIESAGSAIEMSAIGAKNVALLTYQYLTDKQNVPEVGKLCQRKTKFNDLKDEL